MRSDTARDSFPAVEERKKRRDGNVSVVKCLPRVLHYLRPYRKMATLSAVLIVLVLAANPASTTSGEGQ